MAGGAALLALLPAVTALPFLYTPCSEGEGSLHDHTLPLLDGSANVSLSDYAGKVVLLVNVATYWGFATQYSDFNALKEAYNQDMEILAVPCAHFFNQEPSGDPTEITNVIRHVRPGNDFTPGFPMFARSEINGENRIPLYKLVTDRCPSPVPTFQDAHYLYYSPMAKEDIRWNWEKILFDKNGQPYRRYGSMVEPFEIEEDIVALLAM